MSDMSARNIKRYRKNKGLTQEKLAELVNVSQMSIRRYETVGDKNREPSADIFDKIAEALDTTSDILRGKETDYKFRDTTQDILRHTDFFSGASALAEEYEKKQKLKQISDSVNKNIQQSMTIAAHFDGTEYTEEELEEIKRFAEFVKSKRNK